MESGRRPFLVLVAIVLGVAIMPAPRSSCPRPRPPGRAHLRGRSGLLAEGDGLRLRHEPYQLGPLYPAVPAPISPWRGAGWPPTPLQGREHCSSPWPRSRSTSSRDACCARGGASESPRSRSRSRRPCTSLVMTEHLVPHVLHRSLGRRARPERPTTLRRRRARRRRARVRDPGAVRCPVRRVRPRARHHGRSPAARARRARTTTLADAGRAGSRPSRSSRAPL
jgi:hypothetical protein